MNLYSGLALLSAILYGVADFMGGIATRRWAVLAAGATSQLIGLIVLAAVAPFVPAIPMQGNEYGFSLGAGVAAGVGIPLLYYGLSLGPVTVVAPITAVCSIAVPVLVAAIRGERPSPAAAVGIALAIVAVVLISQSAGENQPVNTLAETEPVSPARTRATGRAIAIALAAGIGIGLFLVCLASTGRRTGLWPLVLARGISVVTMGAAALWMRSPLAMPASARGATALCGLLDITANGLYLLAVRQGALGLIATLASLYPASTILLGRVVLKERISWTQVCGLAFALVAIVLITTGTAAIPDTSC